eukprot:COSAG02_NODE_4756_length_5022_cov_1.825107_9_plen_55_part_01
MTLFLEFGWGIKTGFSVDRGLSARPRRSAADSIRSVSEVEEVVCVCEGNRGYIVR